MKTNVKSAARTRTYRLSDKTVNTTIKELHRNIADFVENSVDAPEDLKFGLHHLTGRLLIAHWRKSIYPLRTKQPYDPFEEVNGLVDALAELINSSGAIYAARVTAKLSPSLTRRLKRMAKETNLTVSQIVREALSMDLDGLLVRINADYAAKATAG